jgi:rhodanese-related sulfurtransferase
VSASPPARIDALLAEVRNSLPHRPTAKDLPALRARRALIVDIRPAAQRANDGELAGAVVIERNVLEWRLDPTSPDRLLADLDENREIVVVCNEGYASSLAAASLQQLGLRRATDLDGGIQSVLTDTGECRCGPSAATRLLGLITIVLTAVSLVLAGMGPAAAQSARPLVGTFRVTGGGCSSTGSYFRMILPTGGSSGPFVSNADSSCPDKTFTALSPGANSGLVTGTYQVEPGPAFDTNGNGRSSDITQPATFFGVQFSTSTNATDPQTGTGAPPPTISVDESGALSGNLESFAASWNNQEFNQGAPKPGGARPGLTSGPSGSYDASSGAFTLEWTSQIVGGPFNNFTGQWHLSGTFAPAAGSAGPAAPAPASGPGGASVAAAAPASAPASSGATASGASDENTAAPQAEEALPAPAASGAAGETRLETTSFTRTSTPVPLWIGLVLLGAGVVIAASSIVGRAASRRFTGASA